MDLVRAQEAARVMSSRDREARQREYDAAKETQAEKARARKEKMLAMERVCVAHLLCPSVTVIKCKQFS
jgi:hypothetical protein